MRYWLTGDEHYYHMRVCEYSNRPFKDVDEMNFKLIENNNLLVKDDDVVIHVGDFSFANKTEKKADATPAKQEETKKEAQTIKVDPQIQYVVTKSDNGGWVVQVMLGGQRLYTYVYDNKGFEDYWKKQISPPVEKKEVPVEKPKEEVKPPTPEKK